jgi:hypothetical protein
MFLYFDISSLQVGVKAWNSDNLAIFIVETVTVNVKVNENSPVFWDLKVGQRVNIYRVNTLSENALPGQFVYQVYANDTDKVS